MSASGPRVLMICQSARPVEGFWYSATICFQAAVSVAPDVPRYRFHLARAYRQLGRYPEAREQYARLQDLDPGGPFERLATRDLVALP